MDDEKLKIRLHFEYHMHKACARDYLEEKNMEMFIAHSGGATAIHMLYKTLFGEEIAY